MKRPTAVNTELTSQSLRQDFENRLFKVLDPAPARLGHRALHHASHRRHDPAGEAGTLLGVER